MSMSFLDSPSTRQHQPVDLTPPGTLPMLPAPTPVPMLALGGEDDDDENPALLPNPVEPIDHAPL